MMYAAQSKNGWQTIVKSLKANGKVTFKSE